MKKIMKKLFVLFVIMPYFITMGCKDIFGVGSNVYAENYNMHTSKEKLINAIKIFKNSIFQKF